jgi:hypothetical protein
LGPATFAGLIDSDPAEAFNAVDNSVGEEFHTI